MRLPEGAQASYHAHPRHTHSTGESTTSTGPLTNMEMADGKIRAELETVILPESCSRGPTGAPTAATGTKQVLHGAGTGAAQMWSEWAWVSPLQLRDA